MYGFELAINPDIEMKKCKKYITTQGIPMRNDTYAGHWPLNIRLLLLAHIFLFYPSIELWRSGMHSQNFSEIFTNQYGDLKLACHPILEIVYADPDSKCNLKVLNG